MYIETPRMLIRNFCLDDTPDLHEIFGDAETMENCEPAYDLAKTKDFLSSFCIARNGALAAVHRNSGKVIGYMKRTCTKSAGFSIAASGVRVTPTNPAKP